MEATVGHAEEDRVSTEEDRTAQGGVMLTLVPSPEPTYEVRSGERMPAKKRTAATGRQSGKPKRRKQNPDWGQPLVALRMPQELIDAMDEMAKRMPISDENGVKVRYATRSEAIRFACVFLLENEDQMLVKRGPFSI